MYKKCYMYKKRNCTFFIHKLKKKYNFACTRYFSQASSYPTNNNVRTSPEISQANPCSIESVCSYNKKKICTWHVNTETERMKERMMTDRTGRQTQWNEARLTIRCSFDGNAFWNLIHEIRKTITYLYLCFNDLSRNGYLYILWTSVTFH